MNRRDWPQLLGRRVALWCAVIGMAVGLAAMLMGCASGQPVGAPVDPLVLPAVVTSAPETMTNAQPRALTYQQWRAETPLTIALPGEAQAALIAAGMPWKDAERLADLAANCEAPVRDVDGTSIGINLHALGDGGLAVSGFQVRIDAHPWAARLLMTDLGVAAGAAARIYQQAGSLAPWSCK